MRSLTILPKHRRVLDVTSRLNVTHSCPSIDKESHLFWSKYLDEMAIYIRPETPADVDVIHSLPSSAFRLAKRRGGNEAQIVDGLSAGRVLMGFVATAIPRDPTGVKTEKIVGHVAFSPG